MTDIGPTNPIGDAIAQGLNAHHDYMREAHQEHRKAERLDLLEHLEQEGVEAVQQLIGAHLNCGNLSPETAVLVQRLCRPEHQAELGAVAGILIAVGYTLGQAALAGPISEITMASMAYSGSGALDPNQMATAANAGRITRGTAEGYMREVGIKQERAQTLFDLSYGTISNGEAMTLWRWGRIGDGDFQRVLKLNGLDDGDIQSMMKLRQGPPDVSFAVNAATQNQIGWDAYVDLLKWNGIEEGWAKSMYETAGATMPPDMAMRLFREGWIDEPKFEEILTESNLKNKYVPVMKNLRFRYPPMEQTLRMFRHGVIDGPKAQEYLEKQGFFPLDAEKLVASAKSVTTAGQKNLSPSTIEKLYEVGKYDRGQAATALTALGYDATEADLLLTLVDEHKSHLQQDRAANAVLTRYASWKIDRSEAVTLLDRVGVPGPIRDDMLEAADARREAQTLHLSEAFLHKAYTKNAITRAEVETRLKAMGYDAADTALIMATDFPETAAAAGGKNLTRADQVKRYKLGQITWPQLSVELQALGYSAQEAEQIANLAVPPTNGAKKPSDKDLSRADQVKRFKAQQITRAELLTNLQALGYDATEAEQIALISE